MALRLAGKQKIVAKVAEYAHSALGLVVAEYSGIKVANITDFRAAARKQGLKVNVVRNTLARKALCSTKFAAIVDQLVGPLVLVFAPDDPGAAARLLQEYSKKYEALKVVALCVDGRALPASALAMVADMPTRDQAIAQLLGLMMSPVTNLVRTMAEPYAQVVRVLSALSNK